MRILLDTNILARSAAGPPGLANELLILATAPEHVLLLSPFIASELSRVLRYERLRRVHGFTDKEVDQFIADVQAIAEIVLPPSSPERVVAADPDDDPVIATALAGNAAVLCTLDRHLLHPAVIEFCRQKGVEVLTDRELLTRLQGR